MMLTKGQKIILIYISAITLGSFIFYILLSFFIPEEKAQIMLIITTFGVIAFPFSILIYLCYTILKIIYRKLPESLKENLKRFAPNIMKKVILIISGVVFAGVLLLIVLYLNSFEYKMKQQEKMVENWKTKVTQDESKIFKDVDISINQLLNSPSIIQGKANFHWFPEGWFEIYLTDESGNEISKAAANANVYPLIPDKEGYMPFIAEISFETNKTEGILIFKKHEYSELDSDDFKILVKLK